MVNLKDLRQFQHDQYARQLAFKTNNMEVILVCWLPGQGSPEHDHGQSEAVIVVLEGELTHTTIYPDGKKVSVTLGYGDVGYVPTGVKHQIFNHSDHELVTLDIYSPPLPETMNGKQLGYDNTVRLKEIRLPEEAVIRFLQAEKPPVEDDPNYVI